MFEAFTGLDERDRQMALLALAGRLATPSRSGLMGALGEAGLGLAGDLDYYRKRAEDRARSDEQKKLMAEQLDAARQERQIRMQEAQAQNEDRLAKARVIAQIQGGQPAPGGTLPGGVSPQGLAAPITDPNKMLGLMATVPSMSGDAIRMQAQMAENKRQQSDQIMAQQQAALAQFQRQKEMARLEAQLQQGNKPRFTTDVQDFGGIKVPVSTDVTGQHPPQYNYPPAGLMAAQETKTMMERAAAQEAADKQAAGEQKPGLMGSAFNWLSGGNKFEAAQAKLNKPNETGALEKTFQNMMPESVPLPVLYKALASSKSISIDRIVSAIQQAKGTEWEDKFRKLLQERL